MPRPAYAAHARFVEPARAVSDLRLLLIGTLAIEAAFQTSVHLMEPFLLLVPLASPQEVLGGTTPRGLLIQLSSFAILGLAVVMISRRLHSRGFVSLIGPPDLALRQLLRVSLILGALVLIVEFLPPDLEMLEQADMRPIAQWLAILPLALVALLIQTGAEELFYRGYIQQQLAARFSQTWVWMVLPSLLFALAHYSPSSAPTEAAQYLIWSFLFGLAAADLTARSGTLGPAVAFHLVNNALAFLLYADAGSNDSGLSLFLFPTDQALDLLLPPVHHMEEAGFDLHYLIDGPFLLELVGIGILWVGARIAMHR
jgi:uncharacterized protein